MSISVVVWLEFTQRQISQIEWDGPAGFEVVEIDEYCFTKGNCGTERCSHITSYHPTVHQLVLTSGVTSGVYTLELPHLEEFMWFE